MFCLCLSLFLFLSQLITAYTHTTTYFTAADTFHDECLQNNNTIDVLMLTKNVNISRSLSNCSVIILRHMNGIYGERPQ